MKCEEKTVEQTEANSIVKAVAVLRRILSLLEVVHDVTNPWLEGGRADEIINTSTTKASAIDYASWRLLVSLSVALNLLGKNPGKGSLKDPELDPLTGLETDAEKAKKLLTLVRDNCGDSVTYIREFALGPYDWAVESGWGSDEDQFEYVLGCLDYYRWQILKQFARLVVIFDDHDDPDSKESSQEWPKDKAALDKADLIRCKERVC
jgi:hypothetical protein